MADHSSATSDFKRCLLSQPNGKFDQANKDMKRQKSPAASPREESHSKKLNPSKEVSTVDIVEKKRTQNWLKKQFSGKMSQGYDSNNDIEHATAVAAAAYVINLLEESHISDQKKATAGYEPSLTKPKSRKETPISIQEPGEGLRKTVESPDDKAPRTSARDVKMQEKAMGRAPSIKKAPAFADKQLKNNVTTKPENSTPRPDLPLTKTGSGAPKPESAVPKPATPPTEGRRQNSRRPGTEETEADAWEKAEMAKIKERYEKLSKKIISWENEKKAKAEHKHYRKERALETKRKKALEKYRKEMEYIKQIAGGARAQAEERRRNEELKAKEKANIIRTTGKVPKTCFCF